MNKSRGQEEEECLFSGTFVAAVPARTAGSFAKLRTGSSIPFDATGAPYLAQNDHFQTRTRLRSFTQEQQPCVSDGWLWN
jgi:hypothetical protein